MNDPDGMLEHELAKERATQIIKEYAGEVDKDPARALAQLIELFCEANWKTLDPAAQSALAAAGWGVYRAKHPEEPAPNSHAENVSSLVDRLIGEINSGNIRTGDDVSRWLDESSEVIHYTEADQILAESMNEDAYYEETEAERVERTTLATYAMRADLRDELRSRGYDADHPKPRVHCDSCDEDVFVDDPDDQDCPECGERLDGTAPSDDEDDEDGNEDSV